MKFEVKSGSEGQKRLLKTNKKDPEIKQRQRSRWKSKMIKHGLPGKQ